jgi:hypothetical protein
MISFAPIKALKSDSPGADCMVRPDRAFGVRAVSGLRQGVTNHSE